MVSQIGGQHVHVTDLVQPNGDPHEFEPSPKDSKTLSQADVVFVSGLGLEGWLDRLIKASGYKGEVITASKGIKTLKMEEDGKTVTDPHAWNSMKTASSTPTISSMRWSRLTQSTPTSTANRAMATFSSYNSWMTTPPRRLPPFRKKSAKF